MSTTTSWRSAAACRTEDPDLFFPQGNTGPWLVQIEQAKAVCRTCPVIEDCLQYSLDVNPLDGIFAGLTALERGRLRRTAARRKLTPDTITARAKKVRATKPRTLPELVAANTAHDGDHRVWVGPSNICFEGRVYTPKQAAYTADRGHEPDGRVQSNCGLSECVRADHVADHAERTRWRAAKRPAARKVAECGTNSGYAKHRREKTEICDPCRQAHADADARLRRTGSTKQVAA